MGALQIQRRAYLLAAAKLVVENDRFGLVDDAEAGLPQTHTIVSLFVVRRHIGFVESTKLLEKLSTGKQEGARTIIPLAAKHIGRRGWRIAAPVSDGRAILPDHRACFLKRAVGQDKSSANRAD